MNHIRHHAAYFLKALSAAYMCRECFCELTVCVGPSMMPTFNPSGDVALVERMVSCTIIRQRPIQKGDVVIAKSIQNPRQSVCKRVLGLEGDVVCIEGDGRCVHIPKGHVWLQGDNALNSTDSRHYGPVPYATLQGRVVTKVYPTLSWKDLSRHD
jgi:signal peptidase I